MEGKELNWAILGTGEIADEMAAAFKNMGRNIYAVGNRTYEKAVNFAAKYSIKKVYKNHEDMFKDEKVDVIYIATPHNTHIRFLKEALENHKHVLCEKSITLNSKELETAIELSHKNHVVLAEAMTIWHMPLYKQLWSMIKDEKMGKVQMLQLNFGSFKEYNMENRFFDKKFAGGALLDIGVYALSLARSFMTNQPKQIKSQVKYALSGVDEQASILLMNEEGQMAAITLSLHSKQPKRAIISCEKGYIEIMEYPRGEKAIIVDAISGEKKEIQAGNTKEALQYEIEDMESAILNGKIHEMKLQETKDVMEIMTLLRDEWGMFYPEEAKTL